jgi:hypothetical protein
MPDAVTDEARCVILVDNSNVFIEGQKFSAHKKGVKRGLTDSRDPQDPSWRIDFGDLLDFMADGRDTIAAILVGSEPPPNDSVKGLAFTILTACRTNEVLGATWAEIDWEARTWMTPPAASNECRSANLLRPCSISRGCAGTTECSDCHAHSPDTNSRRITPSACSDLISDRDRSED